MVKINIKKNTIIYVWCFFMALSIAVRCLPTLVYPTVGIEYIIIMGISAISVILCMNNLSIRKLYICDLFWLFIPLFFLNGKGGTKYVFFTIIALVFYLVIQKEVEAISAIKYPLIIFAVITSVVTWISFFLPNFYTSHILNLFPEGSSLVYSFKNRNMYHGFTNHYSRNSFYITVGILLVFSDLISKQRKNKKITITLLVFLFCTEFLVAKRGLTLFLIITMFGVVLLKEPGLVKKMSKSIKFIIVAILMFVLAYMFVPGVDNMVVRILSPNSSDDISSGRFYLYGIAIKMFFEKPILGYGWGSYLQAMTGTTYQGAHNDYLQLLGETGLVGFLFFMIANLGSLYYSYKSFKLVRVKVFDGTKEQKWMLFSLSYQIFFLLYSLTGLPHFSYEQFTLYIMMCGYGMGMYKYKPKIGGK